MSLQLNIFLLLFGGLQGLLISLFLIQKKLHRSGYVFLLLYFGVMLLQITLKVMSKGWLMTNWGLLYELSYFLPLLYGPLIYLFVRQLLLNRRFRLTDILHFLPFGLMLFFLLPEMLVPFYGGQTNFLFRRDTGMIIQLASILIYHASALVDWRRYRDSVKDYFPETQRLQMNWIRRLLVASFVVCTVIAVSLFLIYITHPRSMPFRYGFVMLTVFIYWVSYSALMQPLVFSDITGKTRRQDAVIPFLPKLEISRLTKKYSNSGLSQEEMISISRSLDKIMHEQKPYLNPELTISDLAASINCNRHRLSQALNEALKQSFYDYVNHYRVEEAKQLLIEPAKEAHKIASIAYDAGFNSLSTFNDVFKKITGQTPTQFRKQVQEPSRQQRG